MTLKELNTYMRDERIGLVPSQQTAIEELGIEVEQEMFGTIPSARADILLTTAPAAGEVLMQLRKEGYYSCSALFNYICTNGLTVRICDYHLERLFGGIPDFLYVTKVEGASE